MDRTDFAEIPTAIYEPYEVVEVLPAEGPTHVIHFDGPLGGDEKVVIGYLTLEEQGWFGRMSLVEQQRALDELRRG
jgi:hypothetical protein